MVVVVEAKGGSAMAEGFYSEKAVGGDFDYALPAQ
jgi:hypothetical protein